MICRSLNDYSQKTYKDSVFSIDDESMPETNTRIVQKHSKQQEKDLEITIIMKNLCILRRNTKTGRHVIHVKINPRNFYLNEYVARNLR